jgi:hypothetical protein
MIHLGLTSGETKLVYPEGQIALVKTADGLAGIRPGEAPTQAMKIDEIEVFSDLASAVIWLKS